MLAIRFICHGGLFLFTLLELTTDFLSLMIPGLSGLKRIPVSVITFVPFIALALWILYTYRSRIVRLVYTRLVFTYLFCAIVLGVQGSHGQTSFTTAIYLLPILQLIHFMHPTPFDANSGTFDESAFKA
ncbi:MAG: hypothetical protein J5973_00410, partial [Eubacterium sp.]|nr:hypothetical protein [Eubacterium sp.]